MKKLIVFSLLSLILFGLISCSNDSKPNGIKEIEVELGENRTPLNGIICSPKDIDGTPVVIFVHGSGQSDYDETIYNNKPFKDIAEGLAANGITSLRYNKRYFQHATSAPADITIEDEVLDDVKLAIDFVKNYEGLENSKIFIIGHSLGGMLAPYIAQTNDEVDGIVCLAGSPRRLEDIILDQNIALLETTDNLTEEEKQNILDSQVIPYVNMVKELKEGDESIYLFNVPSIYWLSLNKIDTAEISKNLSIPMLILQGDADFQVFVENDFNLWKNILKDNDNAEFKLYANLNHLFMQTIGKKDVTEYQKKQHVDEQVITDIAEWINRHS